VARDRDPILCRTFVRLAREALATRPEVKHSLSIDAGGDHCILDIPPCSDAGFNITIQVFPSEIVVSMQGAHEHFRLEDGPEDLVRSVLGLVRDLLSPAMRVREQCAGGWPFRWHVEMLQNDGTWHTETTTGLFFWNYFGRRSERIYQNHVLPSRTN
jgi:hypothetical protein